MYAPGEPVGDYVSFYVAVDNLEKSLAQAETLGAKVAQPPTPLADGSRVAMVNDPEGHRIVLIQQAQAAGLTARSVGPEDQGELFAATVGTPAQRDD